MKVAIAGASGFIGRQLTQELKKNYSLIALSRSKKQDAEVEWRECDLFSLLDAEKALYQADVAFYLVHSMQPTAHLSQGRFEDFDLIVADNFLRAAIKNKVQRIIYLGGAQPMKGFTESSHLHSRKEIEELFLKSSIPTTVLRASMIIGATGSSFNIMVRLVQKLPWIPCPSWAQTESQPVALEDVIKSLKYVLEEKSTQSKVYDIGGGKPVSYRQLMQEISQILGLKRTFFRTPFLSTRFSTSWICLLAGAPFSLVRPLIEGLKKSLYVDPKKALTIPGHSFLSYEKSLQVAMRDYRDEATPVAFNKPKVQEHVVRSVQRISLPLGISAQKAADLYMEFLPQMKPRVIQVTVEDNWIYFQWAFPRLNLLVLEHAPERSGSDRQLFYVRGGLLAKKTIRGRLEFREVLQGTHLLAAIHDFEPRLPWYLYRWSQALIHLWVMNQFGIYLKRKSNILEKRSV